MRTTTKLFSLGLGLALGTSALVAAAEGDAPTTPSPTTTTTTIVEPTPIEVEGDYTLPTPTPEVTPTPTPETLPTCPEGETLAEDLSCVPNGYWDEPAPAPTASPAQPHEDDPAFDCRIHGNRICGVEVEGTYYLIQFDASGSPASVTFRD